MDASREASWDATIRFGMPRQVPGRRLNFSLLLVLSLAVVGALVIAAPVQAYQLERASVSSAGVQGNGESEYTSISADGRYVTFRSGAANLVPGDTNGMKDIFRRDLKTGTTTRVSLSSAGIQGNGDSALSPISADGRYVAFFSEATNLVPGDTNGTFDVFLRDVQTGTTTRLSVSSAGVQGNGGSGYPSMSADGRYVVFHSTADNLVSGDTNDAYDVFLRDVQTGTTTRVSVSSAGIQGDYWGSTWPSISADGRYVTFSSHDTNLVPGDTNGKADVFLRDLQTHTTTRVSVSSAGAQGNDYSDRSYVSADGRYIAFRSVATNLVPGDTNGRQELFLRDLQAGTTTRLAVSPAGVQGDGGSNWCSFSADGRRVAFDSIASNLVPGDTDWEIDVFLRDLQTGTTTRLSVSSAGAQGDGYSGNPSISADGRYVAFQSEATNLVPGDTNGVSDIFVVRTPPDFHDFTGTDRYDTSIMISKDAYPAGAPAVFLVKGDNFPDALAAAPLAAAYGGPVVITPSTGLTPAVAAELQRLNPSKVFFIGLPDKVKTDLRAALPPVAIQPIVGTDRYHTAVLLAEELKKKLATQGRTVDRVVLAAGDKFPDALSVAPLAAKKGWAILLTPQAGPLPTVTADEIGALGVTQGLRVGTWVKFPASVTTVRSLVGTDRYHTSVLVAEYAKTMGLSFAHVALATGDNYPDALVVAPCLVANEGILLLTLRTALPAPVRDCLIAHAAEVRRLDFVGLGPTIQPEVKGIVK